MELNRIKEQFSQVQQSINRATQACQNDSSAASELRDSVNELGKRSDEARQWVQHSEDEDAIRRCIDELEERGDRAKRACENSGGVNQQLKSAVLQAHKQISDLKHQIH